MKNLLKLLAILTIAFPALFAKSALGQNQNVVPPAGLPASLPIDNRTNMMSWVATNLSAATGTAIYYTNLSNQRIGRALGDFFNWSSYAEFDRYASSNAFYLFNAYKTEMSPASGIEYMPYIYNYNVVGSGLTLRVLNIDSVVGTVSTVTSNSFVMVPPQPLVIVVPVAGLQRFSVWVSNANGQVAYSYTWTPSGSFKEKSLPIYPPEYTTNNYAVLNEWYCGPTNSTRFAIVAGGVTNNYTQYGDLIRPALRMNGKSKLIARVARGSTTCIKSSTDLVNWSVLTNVYSYATNTLYFNTDTSKPALFFRAVPMD